MGIYARRIIEIKRDNIFCKTNSKTFEWLENNVDFLDQRNMDGASQVEFQFKDLKKALEKAEEIGLSKEEKSALEIEIQACEKEDYTDEDFVVYDCF